MGLTLIKFEKCHTMSFRIKCSTIKWPYKLSDSTISLVDTIFDNCFKFNNDLIPGPSTSIGYVVKPTVCKYIKILIQDFKLGLSLKTLYYALVRPISVLWCCSVWDSHTPGHSLDKLKWSNGNSIALLVLFFIFNIHYMT